MIGHYREDEQGVVVRVWCALLRGGAYKQGKHHLRHIDENGVLCHCALGVLGDAMVEGAVPLPTRVPSLRWEEVGGRYILVSPTHAFGSVPARIRQGYFINWNDYRQASFRDIAVHIEEMHAKGRLFMPSHIVVCEER